MSYPENYFPIGYSETSTGVWYRPKNSAATVLAHSHILGDGTLRVTNAIPFGAPSPESPVRVVADTGVVQVVFSVTGIVDNTLTIGTVLEDTADVSLPAGTLVECRLTAGDILDLQYNMDSVVTILSGAVLTSQVSGQTIGATGARLTKLWATDITCTNAITGSITGNSGTVTNGVYTTGAGTVYLAPTGSGAALTGITASQVGADPVGTATSALAAWTGTSNVVTLGTIVTGTWHGTAIDDSYIASASTWNAKQSGSASLTSVAGLTYVSPSFVKMTAAGTFGLDTTSYLTSQSGAILADQTSGQTIGSTGARLTKLWATDITCTNAMAGSITGNSDNVSGTVGITHGGTGAITARDACVAIGAISSSVAIPGSPVWLLDANNFDATNTGNTAFASGDLISTWTNLGSYGFATGPGVGAAEIYKPKYLAHGFNGRDCMVLDGNRGYPALTSSASNLAFIHSTASFDIVMVVRLDAVYGSHLFGNTNTSTDIGFAIECGTTGILSTYITNGSTANSFLNATGLILTPGIPNIVRVRCNGSTLYASLNGGLESSQAVTGVLSQANASRDYMIGINPLNSTGTTSGVVAWVGVWSGNLTSPQWTDLLASIRSWYSI